MIKNNKGFTLVELIAVVLILALIGILVIPAIGKTIKDTKSDLYESQVTALIDGMQNWVADHPRLLPSEPGEKVYVSLGQLKLGNYIDMDIKNPKTDKYFNTEIRMSVEKNVSTDSNGNVLTDKYIYDCDNPYTSVSQQLILNKYHCDYINLEDEEKNDDWLYPDVQFIGDMVIYLNKGETYNEQGLMIDDTACTISGCTVKHFSLNIDITNIDTNNYGSYYVKYTITNAQVAHPIVLYRTVIVR